MHHVFIAQLKGNAISTDCAFAILFPNPPVHLLGRGDIVRELLNHATTSSGYVSGDILRELKIRGFK
jgi:hypothetical protein